MNKPLLQNNTNKRTLIGEIQKDTAAVKNAILLALERIPVTSLGCLLYANTTGVSVYGNRLSTLERTSSIAATPLSAAIHLGFFKKCGLSLYEHMRQAGYDHNACMEILRCIDNNAGSTMIIATLATTLLYGVSKISDIKALLKSKIDRTQ